jgi:hypothetical protein
MLSFGEREHKPFPSLIAPTAIKVPVFVSGLSDGRRLILLGWMLYKGEQRFHSREASYFPMSNTRAISL